MGLLDVLNGMQNGPRGPSHPETQSSSGGMSPMTMAILALLAWKAVKHFGGNHRQRQPGSTGSRFLRPLPPALAAGLATFSPAAWAACSLAAPRAAC